MGKGFSTRLMGQTAGLMVGDLESKNLLYGKELEKLKTIVHVMDKYGVNPYEIKSMVLFPVGSEPRYFRIKGVIQRDADGAPEELEPTIIYHTRCTMKDGTTEVVEDNLIDLLGSGRAS